MVDDIDINQIAEQLNNKADVDLTNATTRIGSISKSYFAGLGMPSNTYVDLTLDVSGTVYRAPANGWYVIGKQASASGQYLNVRFNAKFYFSANAVASGVVICTVVPVLKNNAIAIEYSLGGETSVFRFYYAEGEV